MKNVLIVTESFPPLNNIASRRFGWLAPYMERHGWRPWVLTTHGTGPLPVRIPESRVVRLGRDSHERGGRGSSGTAGWIRTGLRRAARTLVEVAGFRSNMLYPANFGWFRDVSRRQGELRARLPAFDLLIGSFGPTGALCIARRLSEQWHVPWIADLRDLRALRHDGRNWLSAAIDRAIERRLLATAAAITTVSETLAAMLAARYGHPTRVIYNGWDDEAAPQTARETRLPPAWASPATRRGYLYYAGLLYPHQLTAVRLLLEALRRDAELNVVMRLSASDRLMRPLERLADETGMTSRLHILPPCDPWHVDREAEAAFANLVFEDLDRRWLWSRGTLTGKFLKLVALRPPVLSIARCDSDMGPILTQTRKGSLCSTADQIADFLAMVRQSPSVFEGDRRQIDRYAMCNQARILCGLLDEIVNERTALRTGRHAA